MEKENAEHEKAIAEAKELIRKAEEAKRANDLTMVECQASLKEAQLELAKAAGTAQPPPQSPGNAATGTPAQSPSEQAATDAVANLPQKEIDALHKAMVDALMGLSAREEIKTPYAKYVAAEGAKGEKAVQPGQWMTLMLTKIARAHEEAGVPEPTSTPQTPQTAQQTATKRKEEDQDADAAKPAKAPRQTEPAEDAQAQEPMQ